MIDRNPDMHTFPKWLGVMDNYEPKPVVDVGIIGQAEALELMVRAGEKFNPKPYCQDAKDYWMTPDEFEKAAVADCEDYAIAKYYWLLEHGFKDDWMDICIVSMKHPRIAHAVLIIEAFGQNTTYLADSSPRSMGHFWAKYEPYYAINRLGWRRLTQKG